MTAPAIVYAVVVGCITVIYIGRRCLGNSRPTFPLPPGPPGIPWVGNVIGINTSAPWLTYREWAKTYGDIVYSRLLGKDIIILNSEEIAKDLLENRSSNYSDRPYLITNEMCGVDFATALLRYGDRWRLHRRFGHQTFRLDAAPRFLPLQYHKGCQLLRQLLCAPKDFDDHVFEYTASVILNSVYDYDPTSRNDKFITSLTRVQDIALSVVRPDTAIILGTFPIIRKIPAWLPGMSFKNKMAAASEFARQYVESVFEYSVQKRSSTVAPTMVHDALQKVEEEGRAPDKLWMKILGEAAASAALAASETSYSTLMTFILMVMLNPTVQEKAQAQIDDVVGKDRLPSIDDRPLLPLIDAIFWETLRYNPVTPLSIPHAAVNDDVYDGFHIPKGAILIPNLWSMGHDESRYPNPHSFMPERFLNDDGSLKPNDVLHIAYGFGRRMCVGRHFADTSVWSTIAKVLAVFKILKPLDENGLEISVEPKFSSALAVHPLPFECRIVPRFPGMNLEKLEELIAGSTA